MSSTDEVQEERVKLHYHLNFNGDLVSRMIEDCGEEAFLAYVSLVRRTDIRGVLQDGIDYSSLPLVYNELLDNLSEKGYIEFHQVMTLSGEVIRSYVYLPYHDKISIKGGGAYA